MTTLFSITKRLYYTIAIFLSLLFATESYVMWIYDFEMLSKGWLDPVWFYQKFFKPVFILLGAIILHMIARWIAFGTIKEIQ